MTGKTENYTEYGKDITNRLSRSVGHLKSVKRMVENERNCSEVLVEECLDTAVTTGDLERIKEINVLMDRFL